MKLLILGDLAQTGFGTVTMDLGRALLARKLDCRFISFNEMPDLPEPFASRTTQLGKDGWLRISDDPEVAAETSRRLETMFSGGGFEDGWVPDTALIIGDVGSIKMSPVLQFVPEGFPVYNYVPIEGMDLPPAWRNVWAKASPIAMSEFGAGEIEKVMGGRPPMVYHGVDTEVFRPATIFRPLAFGGKVLRSREDCKRYFGMDPNRTMLLRTDRLMPRKGYASLLRSLAPVIAKHPEVDLVLHCRLVDEGGDIRDELSKYKPEITGRIHLTAVGGAMNRDALVALYNAADLYVSNSAEGFGLTIAEALACGTPAVGIDDSSVPEVIGSCGMVVPVGQLLDNPYSYFWALPDEEAYADAVSFLVSHKHRREQLGMLGPMHVRAKFRWSAAAEQFEAILDGHREIEAVA